MIEIEFRVFVKDKGKIFTVKQMDLEYEMIWFEEENKAKDTMRMFEQVELMQYTGLKDKNGKKIFEGDIVGVEFLNSSPTRLSVVAKNVKFIHKVIFKNGCFGLQSKIDRFTSFDGICNTEFEVIGNIYDNPELIGE